jgi:DNA-binding GntR family transcriptional regulator
VADVTPFPKLKVTRLSADVSLRRRVCDAIKHAITEMDIYGHPQEIRLDERQLSEDLGVSRTPIREALTVLEQEGFVRSVPRRGIYVVRKTKREIIEMITVWAAIESLAARLACARASDEQIGQLRALFTAFDADLAEHLSEYSQANMEFHKALIRAGGCELMTELTENLFIHMRAIRDVTIRQDHRYQRSMVDHMNIIEALERRDADLAARLVREHTLGLATHVEKYGDHLHDVRDDASERRRHHYG